MHHNVGVTEGVVQGPGVADIPTAVRHLRPTSMRPRSNAAPGDAHDPRHPAVGLEQGIKPNPKVPVGPVTATVRFLSPPGTKTGYP